MKRIALILFALLTLTTIYGQSKSASFSVNVPPGNISVGSKFQIIFVLRNAEGNPSSFNTPQLQGCKLIYGPSVSSSQSYQIINGKQSSFSATEYTYYYKAEKEGTVTIPPTTISVGGKKYTTKAATIKITAASSGQQKPANNASRPVSIDDYTTQSSDRSIKGNDVFVRISTSRSSSYEQEAIECTIKLYTKYNIAEFMPITQPAFNGFTVEDLPIQSSLNDRETVNGQEYATAVVKKCILFPQKSGDLTIISGTYDLTVVQYDQVNLGFYSVGQPVTKKIRVNSNSAHVKVLPLPSPQPAGFNGAVGQFTVKTNLPTNSFRTNEPATLSYTVSGTGNIRYIKDPEIDFPAEFELYSPQHNVDAKVVGNNVQGVSQTDQTFVPKETGNFKIVIPDFIYFDPAKNSYETIPGKTLDLKIARGLSSSAEKQDVKSKNSDIIYIMDCGNSLSKTHEFNIDKFWYWLIYIIAILAVAGFIGYHARQNKLSKDVVGLKRSKANKVARNRLKLAKKFMDQIKYENFYEEILRAMWGYFGDKLSISGAELSRNKVEESLKQYQVSDATLNDLNYVIDTCEMARYTPSDTPQQVADIYDKSTDIINAIEKIKIKK
ncbi:MAG: BatD family protein [Bacteroides sp.]|nr:BatD family protein [Bacteroides sp.]